MRWCTLLVIVALIVLAFVLWRKNVKEHFFNGETMVVSWQPPSGTNLQNITYNWLVFNDTGNVVCNPTDPTQWPNASNLNNSGSNTSVTLSASNCPTCDFGQTILFAVQSFDTVANLTSPWVISTFNLANQDAATIQWLDYSGGQIKTGTTRSNFIISNLNLSAPTNTIALLYPTVVRGSTTYSYAAAVPIGTIATTQVSDPIFFYNGTGLTPWVTESGASGAPDYLQEGDVVSVTALILPNNSPNTPPNYYGTTTVTISSVAHGSPTGVTYTITS